MTHEPSVRQLRSMDQPAFADRLHAMQERITSSSAGETGAERPTAGETR